MFVCILQSYNSFRFKSFNLLCRLGKKTLIGDLKKEKLKDIWNGDKLKQIQLKHINKRRCEIEVCKNCTYLHTAQDNLDSLTEEQFLSRF